MLYANKQLVFSSTISTNSNNSTDRVIPDNYLPSYTELFKAQTKSLTKKNQNLKSLIIYILVRIILEEIGSENRFLVSRGRDYWQLLQFSMSW